MDSLLRYPSTQSPEHPLHSLAAADLLWERRRAIRVSLVALTALTSLGCWLHPQFPRVGLVSALTWCLLAAGAAAAWLLERRAARAREAILVRLPNEQLQRTAQP
jgi:hypothetical protein